jgi:hypothetical protein
MRSEVASSVGTSVLRHGLAVDFVDKSYKGNWFIFVTLKMLAINHYIHN